MARAKRTIKKGEKQRKRNADPLDSPMMRQYLELKKKYPQEILFFRMGDFYEMFLEDAETAAPIMDIALTNRQNSIPMAGVPYHSVDTYIARLIGAGKKIAIAEQEIDPENPKLMRRSVRRVITPGTVIEESLLDSFAHNYLMSISPDEKGLGLALADVSTGDFFALELFLSETCDSNELEQRVRDYYFGYAPREILLPSDFVDHYKEIIPEARDQITPMEDWKASKVEGERQIDLRYKANLRGLGFPDKDCQSLSAVSLILHYIAETFPVENVQLIAPVYHESDKAHMILDEQTLRNLDIFSSNLETGESRTLFNVLNFCRTTTGKRFLKEKLLTPLLDKEKIERRNGKIAILIESEVERRQINLTLDEMTDLERVLGRMSTGKAAPRDFRSVRETIKAMEKLVEICDSLTRRSDIFQQALVLEHDLVELKDKITEKIVDDPPAILGNGPLMRSGINNELDRARDAVTSGSDWILKFEKEERKRTGLSTLRIKYNRIVGYFIEISRGQATKVPDDYERRQTLIGNERFTCQKLRELEETIMKADIVIEQIEKKLFTQLCDEIICNRSAIKSMMKAIASLDFINSLAIAAIRNKWCRPVVVETGELLIEEGRHPVVEAFLPTGDSFIPNNAQLDAYERSFALLTGPNMAGKSTYIRQIALIQLMMQIGSFVPARHATLSIVDRIFTRIGAADNLTRGESTFYVEMLETAKILNQATARSLIVMDEIGRGTSTYDGLSIAWAVVEYLSDESRAKPRVLFATHYHELTALDTRPGVFNLTMDVREVKGKVLFMHRVREGAADRSYGIHVAQLAGLPETVTKRAEEKLQELEKEYVAEKERQEKSVRQMKRSKRGKERPVSEKQKTLFD